MRLKQAVRAVCIGLAALPWMASQGAVRLIVPSTLLRAPAFELVRGDLDGDGVLDEGHVAGRDRINVELSSPKAPAQFTLTAPGRILSIADVDINGDGDLDLVASLADGGVTVWINKGHGSFQVAPKRPTTPSSGVSSTLVALSPFGPVGVVTRVTAWVAPQSIATVTPESKRSLPDAFPAVARGGFSAQGPARAPPVSSL